MKKLRLKDINSKIRVTSTANPDGSAFNHEKDKEFRPNATFIDGAYMYIHHGTNTVKSGGLNHHDNGPLEQAKMILANSKTLVRSNYR